MAKTSIENEELPHANVDRGTNRKIIWTFIAAAIVFVLVFLFLTGKYFSPDNPSGAGHSSPQTTNPTNH